MQRAESDAALPDRDRQPRERAEHGAVPIRGGALAIQFNSRSAKPGSALEAVT